VKLNDAYRDTDLGRLPCDWRIKPLATVGDALIGLTYAPSDVRPYGTLVLRSSNIQNDALAFEDNVFVDMEIPERIMVRPGDVLICVRNGSRNLIGKTALLDARTVGMTFGAFMAVFRSSHGPFINYLFRSHIVKRQIEEHLGATINQITNKSLKSFQIPIPPTDHEIDAIATALSDADALLEGLDRLIAKKRDLKQAAMQQLLTGKTRLPGFKDRWEKMRLGDVGVFLKGTGVRKDEAQTGELPCVRYGEIYTHHNDYVRSYNSWISPAVAATAVRLRRGDILFAGSGETKEEIGKCVAFTDKHEAYAGGDIVILRPHEADPVFMGYYCNTASVKSQKASRGQGDAVVHISASALASVEVEIPGLPEQTAIAAVLSDMDAEIDALEHRRAKTADLKQAMMQELLTGKTRLVEVEPQASDEHAEAVSSNAKGHNWAINEAVVIATLVKHFGNDDYPLGRKRYTKLAYLMHRHVERQAEGYLKKAAGPYNPQTKYGGPEKIAKNNGYIREHKGPKGHSGFVAADNIAQAEGYFEKWYGPDVIQWLEKFRYKKNDDLEVLATVDMAAVELRASGKSVDVAAVKDVIASHPEWEAKLDRAAFSDASIAEAITQCEALLGFETAEGSHA